MDIEFINTIIAVTALLMSGFIIIRDYLLPAEVKMFFGDSFQIVHADRNKIQINLNLTPDEIHKSILEGKLNATDQWQTQILTRILSKADIYVISSIEPEKLGNIGLKNAPSVEDAISKCIEKYGPKMRILILPDGPKILPVFGNIN